VKAGLRTTPSGEHGDDDRDEASSRHGEQPIIVVTLR